MWQAGQPHLATASLHNKREVTTNGIQERISATLLCCTVCSLVSLPLLPASCSLRCPTPATTTSTTNVNFQRLTSCYFNSFPYSDKLHSNTLPHCIPQHSNAYRRTDRPKQTALSNLGLNMLQNVWILKDTASDVRSPSSSLVWRTLLCVHSLDFALLFSTDSFARNKSISEPGTSGQLSPSRLCGGCRTFKMLFHPFASASEA